VLFTPGSGCGHDPRNDALAQKFVARGFLFMLLYRRGHGLSAGEGECAGELMAREQAQRGSDARARLQYRLMTTDHFDDMLAGLASLKELPGIDTARIVIAGHSFGAQLAILIAERDTSVKAVLNFAGAANSWSGSPELRGRLLSAASTSTVPMFIAHAANDFSVEPGQALAAAMERVSRPHELAIYPAIGDSQAEGHAFIYLASDQWEDDVFEFLANHVRE
jgi:dienelactone hydrolase